MDILKNHLYLSVLLFIIISLVIYTLKPEFMFKDNRIIPTGLGANKTIFSYPVIMMIIAIVIYIVVCLCLE